jgi:hypothetical protein
LNFFISPGRIARERSDGTSACPIIAVLKGEIVLDMFRQARAAGPLLIHEHIQELGVRMFQARGSCLGSERCFGRKVVVEAAVGEAGGLHQIGHADAVEATLAKKAASCLDDALAIICGMLFGQFHCAISRKNNSLLDIIMILIIVFYI